MPIYQPDEWPFDSGSSEDDPLPPDMLEARVAPKHGITRTAATSEGHLTVRGCVREAEWFLNQEARTT